MMKRLITHVNEREFETIEKFCKEHGISKYGLVKKSVFLYITAETGQSPRRPYLHTPVTEDEKDILETLRSLQEKGIDVHTLIEEKVAQDSDNPGKKVKD